MSNDLDRLEAFLRERLKTGPFVASTSSLIVIPIQEVLEKIAEMRQPEVPLAQCRLSHERLQETKERGPMPEPHISNPDSSQNKSFTVSIYLDDGRVFEYDVPTESKVREHASAIVTGGYRHCDGDTFEHYPPHRVLKVKSSGISTMYPDRERGT